MNNKEQYTELIKQIDHYNVKSPEELRRQLTKEEVLSSKIIKIKSCGAACLLTSRKVFLKTRFNFDKVGSQETPGEDIGFCNQALKNGFDIFVNTDVKCMHLVKDKPKNIFHES